MVASVEAATSRGSRSPVAAGTAIVSRPRCSERSSWARSTGRPTDRLSRVGALFQGCGLKVNVPADIGGWLWVHFAIEAGVIGSAIAVGDVEEFLDDLGHL